MLIIISRTIIVFFALLTSMRLMGKRQIGELEVSELVIAILISNFASHPLQDISTPLINGILPIIVLLCCELLISGLVVKSPKVRGIICGKPSMLISNGTINQQEMKKNRFTLDELAEELRSQNVLDISTIQYAVLETDGQLNVVLYPSKRTPSVEQLGIKVCENDYPVILINNGQLMKHNLTIMGRDETWLLNELISRNVDSISDVYLMTLDKSGRIYFSQKESSL